MLELPQVSNVITLAEISKVKVSAISSLHREKGRVESWRLVVAAFELLEVQIYLEL